MDEEDPVLDALPASQVSLSAELDDPDNHQQPPELPSPQGYVVPPDDSCIPHNMDSSLRIFLDICCGHNAPLNTALSSFSCAVLSFDILIDPTCDLLDDTQFERWLRICAGGIVKYCAASPACREYSRLKLKPGGPQALRTPEHLDRRPGLDADSLLQVQESFIMLSRCVLCIRLTRTSGNHGHLEQPLTAMSWSEPVVQDFIADCACTCAVISACQVGKDWAKAWLFAGTSSI